MRGRAPGLTREWRQAGSEIGPVREIHCWSDRPGKWWAQNHDRPAQTPPVPPDLNWDLWIGAAPMRPYSKLYHPHDWRGWFDFGTGALGDMAIHNMDPAFYALDTLRRPPSRRGRATSSRSHTRSGPYSDTSSPPRAIGLR